MRHVLPPSSDDDLSTFRVVADPDRERPVRRRALVIIVGDEVTVRPLPDAGELTVGRGSDCDVRIDHASISRRHLLLGIGAGRITVTDRDSANGTSLRGARLPAGVAVEILANELVVAGEVVLLVQEVAAVPAAAAAAPRRPPAPRPSGALSGNRTRVVLDPAMVRLHEVAARVARGTIGVLIAGETGAGKEVLAELIHERSPRAGGPLVRVNCAALSDSLVEGELFGHERGAFTGAAAARAGLIETAAGGTLFLDEVGELSLRIQAKLLRVVEDRQLLRLGAATPRSVDVRVIAATNRDLAAEVEAGRFRRDLYFRLAGVVLEVPPLRARPREIELLARTFAVEIAAGLGRPPPRLGDGWIDGLRRHDWPGNVRELRHVVEQAILLADGDLIETAPLPTRPAPAKAPIGEPAAAPETLAAAPPPSSGAPLGDELAALERQRIVEALAQSGGNQSRAADLLGMPRRTLVTRLGQYGISRRRKR